LTNLDWVIIAVYLAFSLGVGVALSKRASASTGEFFLSGRKLPWWLAGTSMVATSFASDTPLYVTGIVRREGICANWIWWSFAAAGMFSVFLLARLWRRAKVLTDVELTELRYSGKSAAFLRGFRATYFAGPVNCITMAWVILAMIKLMKELFGFSPIVSVGVCVGIATVYCVLSGFWGVVVTDLAQFALAMAGSIGLSVLVVKRMGGMSALREAAAAGPLGEGLIRFFPRPPEGASIFDGAFWEGPMFAFLAFLALQWWANKNADGGGVIVQRMSSTKNERHSVLATLWFNIANYALRPWPWIIVAVASVAVLPELGKGESAYPMMIKRFVPPGLLGVMVASFLGAFMSTIDTHLNLSSSYVVNDIYRRFMRKGASERHYVLVSRIVSVAFMVLASGIALVNESISGLFTFLLAFTSGVGAVYILRWFWWRINAWSEITAMTASGVIASVLSFYKYHPAQNPEGLSYAAILSITVAGSTIAWLTATFLTKPVAMERLAEFYSKVRPFGAWGPVARHCGLEPARGLGRALVNWMAGTAMVLGATLSAGKFLFGFALEGWLWLGVTAVGAVVVGFGLHRQLPLPAGVRYNPGIERCLGKDETMKTKTLVQVALAGLAACAMLSGPVRAQEEGKSEGEAKQEKKVKNILPNGSLEKWTDKGAPEGWRILKAKDSGGNVVKGTEVKHSGKASARFEVGPEGRGFFIQSTFKNEPGKKYRLTFYWKSPVGVVQYAIKTSIPKRGWIAHNGKKWLTRNANLSAKGEKDEWNKATLEFDAFEEAIDMKVEVCRPAGKGKDYKFHVDDIVLEDLKDAEGESDDG